MYFLAKGDRDLAMQKLRDAAIAQSIIGKQNRDSELTKLNSRKLNRQYNK